MALSASIIRHSLNHYTRRRHFIGSTSTLITKRKITEASSNAPRQQQSDNHKNNVTQKLDSGTTTIHMIGQPYEGTRTYLLLPIDIGLTSSSSDDLSTLKKLLHQHQIATIYAHRSILFGAKVSDPTKYSLSVAAPLVRRARLDGSEHGEQVQAISTLNGLSRWVAASVKSVEVEGHDGGDDGGSLVLRELKESCPVVYEACKAMATGVPRPGHSVVGEGTYRDGQEGWERLAKEYCNLGLAEEVELYRSEGGEVVGMEYLAERSEVYLKEAAGTMARMYFL